jgi:hypothetical protein
VDGGAGAVAPLVIDSAVTLRVTGVARYFNAAFLGLWLIGWGIGEVVALAVLALIVAAPFLREGGADVPEFLESWKTAGPPLFVFLFLLVWVAFWTLGGYAAITHFLRSLAGKDRLRLLPAGLEVMRCAGPFRRTRVIDRADIRRVRVRHHDHALVADTTFGTLLLTELGTRPDRETICRWLRGGLQLPPDGSMGLYAGQAPPGWTMQPTEDGSVRLHQRWAWLPWLRSEWMVKRGVVTHRRRIGPWIAEHSYDHAQFAVEHTTDSDGDDLYRLNLRTPRGDRAIDSAINDDAELVDFARWLAEHTGFELQLWK